VRVGEPQRHRQGPPEFLIALVVGKHSEWRPYQQLSSSTRRRVMTGNMETMFTNRGRPDAAIFACVYMPLG